MKYCQISLSRPSSRITSRKIASDSRTISNLSSVISPNTRIPKPGPGNGCLHTKCSGIPNSIPKARTSSLNNVLIGSINSNSMSSGNPPTL